MRSSFKTPGENEIIHTWTDKQSNAEFTKLKELSTYQEQLTASFENNETHVHTWTPNNYN